MKKPFYIGFIICIHFIGLAASADDSTNVQFVFSQKRIDNDKVQFSIKAIIAPGMKLYAYIFDDVTTQTKIHCLHLVIDFIQLVKI